MALLIGAILTLLPLRPLSAVIVCMRLVVLLTAFAILSAFHTVKQSLYINYALSITEMRPSLESLQCFSLSGLWP